jgi:hypothetical protein
MGHKSDSQEQARNSLKSHPFLERRCPPALSVGRPLIFLSNRARIDKLDLAREGASNEKDSDYRYRGNGGLYFTSIGGGGFTRSVAVFFFRATLLRAALLGAGPSFRGAEPELFE